MSQNALKGEEFHLPDAWYMSFQVRDKLEERESFKILALVSMNSGSNAVEEESNVGLVNLVKRS